MIARSASTVSSIATLSALPASVSYLYPDTDDYYYRYGDGYLYQVDRGDNLISALLPLIAGGRGHPLIARAQGRGGQSAAPAAAPAPWR